MSSRSYRLALLLCSVVAVGASPHGHKHADTLAHGHAHALAHLHRRLAAANATTTAVRTNGTFFGPAAVQTESNATTTLFEADDGGALAGLSADCVTALTATLVCNDTLSDDAFLYTWGGLDQDDLAGLCTTSCNASLTAYRAAVATACADDVYVDPVTNDTATSVYGSDMPADIYNLAGVAVRPVALVDYYALNFALLCMVDDTTGAWCYSETSNSSGTVDDCSTCTLEAMRLELEDPRLYDADLASSYSASLSSCQITAPSLTTPTAVFLANNNTVVSGYSTTSTTCPGSVISLPTGAACDDFATAHNISTDLLLTANNLVGGCADFPGSLTSLCVPLSCTPYLVQANDTCRDVAAAHNLTLTQLISYNPSLDRLCANWDKQYGHAICVSNPLGYVAPNGTISGAAGAPTPATTAAPVPTDAMNGTTAKCGAWYRVQKGDQCALIATKNGIALADFYFLNPEIDANCTNLWADQSYCVKAVGDITTYPGYLSGSTPTVTLSLETATAWSDYPTATAPVYNATTTGYPLATGSLSGCSEVFQNDYGNISCFVVANLYDVTVATWVRWNPSVLAAAGNTSSSSSTSFGPTAPCSLQNETAYCGLYYDASLLPVTAPASQHYVAPLANATANATTQCLSWFRAFPNDTCDSICQENDIPFRLFYAWNPALGEKCENLWAFSEYCVEGPGWEDAYYNETTSTTGTTSATSSGGPPAPPANCNRYGVATSGQGCSDFATANSITLDQLYEWNTVLENACDNFWVGEAYCIGVSS